MRNKIKIFSLVLVFVFSLGAFAPVLAATNNGSQGTDAIRQARVLESRIKAVKKLMANQLGMITRASGRMADILDRIETRTEKMDAAGINVSSIETLIVAAKTKQDAIGDLLADAQEEMDNLSTSENPKAAAMAFIKNARELKKKLIDLHKTLIEIVRKMKALEKAHEQANVQDSEEGEDNE